ncbi:MAG: hypothetical protein ABSA96_15955 [Candidatus Acidiferrales bacterium]|jgi:hypothetical protein
MQEDKYRIPLPPEPEETQLEQHPREQKRATIAILIAIIASSFTGWQAWEARQARIDSRTAATQARDEAKRTFDLQVQQVRSSEDAAKHSADLAAQSVAAFRDLVATGRAQLKQSAEMFQADQRPRLYPDPNPKFGDGSDYVRPGNPVTVQLTIRNQGKTDAIETQIDTAGAVATTTPKFEYGKNTRFPGILDLGANATVSFNVVITPPSPLPDDISKLRLYLYGIVRNKDTLPSRNSYQQTWCMFYPIAIDGRIRLDDVHGCTEGDPTKLHQ